MFQNKHIVQWALYMTICIFVLTACKNEKMQWECGFANENFYAGFPHLYWAGTPLPGRFVRAAERYSKTKG